MAGDTEDPQGNNSGLPEQWQKENQATASHSDPTAKGPTAAPEKGTNGSKFPLSVNVAENGSLNQIHSPEDRGDMVEVGRMHGSGTAGLDRHRVGPTLKHRAEVDVSFGKRSKEFLSSVLRRFWPGKKLPWLANPGQPSGVLGSESSLGAEGQPLLALPMQAKGVPRRLRVAKLVLEGDQGGGKARRRPQNSHESFNDSAASVVVSNGYTYFYKFGPRWRANEGASERAWACYSKQQRQLDFQKRHQMAARQVAALEYHREFVAPPFQLPETNIPSLALEFARGDYIVTIVTTACLPWLTGTSINPLLRAAYLEQVFNLRVTILFPWIPIDQQRVVYNGTVFGSPEEQAGYVKRWVERRLSITTRMRILFYDAWYDPRKGSIFPLDRSDVTESILAEEADVAVLEEPEHLCWFHLVGPKWRSKFPWVVGVAHTNYVEYIRRDRVHGGPTTAKFVYLYNWLVARANCHRVIRLSAGVQPFADSVVCNVHGVSPQFLREHSTGDSAGLGGEEGQDPSAGGRLHFSRGFYFIGKVLWGKGYRELCDLLLFHCQRYGFPAKPQPLPAVDGSTAEARCTILNGNNSNGNGDSIGNGHGAVHRSAPPGARERCTNGEAGGRGRSEVGGRPGEVWVEVYGSGFDEEEVKEFASRHALPLRFHGKRDHADPELREYKVFVNPSVSDVLCTTTAEALAMGKIAVVADHPSNEFFRDSFPENCIVYDFRSPEAFSAALLRAQAQQPAPLRPEQRRLLTWEAATERFMAAACLA